MDEGLAYQIKLYRNELMKNVAKHRADVRHEDVFLATLKECRPHCVVNLANLPLANRGHRSPKEAYEGIVSSTFSLLASLSEYASSAYHGVDLVHFSSSMVYGDFTKDPQPEDVVLNPKDIYGCCKAASEDLVTGFGGARGIRSTIIRPSAVYGFGDLNRRVSQVFLEKILHGQKITANNPDVTFLDFTYVQDLVEGAYRAILQLSKGLTGTFNITTGNARSISELIDIMSMRYFPDIEVEIIKTRSFRPNRGSLDINKARTLLGYEPKWSLETGMAEYIDMTLRAMECIK
jgi:nucleoside-diphosphate-sugar epimerase